MDVPSIFSPAVEKIVGNTFVGKICENKRRTGQATLHPNNGCPNVPPLLNWNPTTTRPVTQ